MADNENAKDLDTGTGSSGLASTDAEKEWAPVKPEEPRPQVAQPKPASTTSFTRSLSRQRSHNYWSCDENNDEAVRQEGGEEEKDPFEVAWENGEEDPMNPRSKSKIGKWTIVLICSAASFCV